MPDGRFLMVGAGLSGAVIGRALAEAGHAVTVVDERPHVAGNCHTERCPETGVLVHVYGPHIFHTDDAGSGTTSTGSASDALSNRVKATTGGQVYALPVNLHTINQFFGRDAPRRGARLHRRPGGDRPIADPQNFEEQALASSAPRSTRRSSGATPKSSGAAPRAELPAEHPQAAAAAVQL
jgi:UDP-galactopyranose mutase